MAENKKTRVPGKPRHFIDCYLDEMDKVCEGVPCGSPQPFLKRNVFFNQVPLFVERRRRLIVLWRPALCITAGPSLRWNRHDCQHAAVCFSFPQLLSSYSRWVNTQYYYSYKVLNVHPLNAHIHYCPLQPRTESAAMCIYACINIYMNKYKQKNSVTGNVYTGSVYNLCFLRHCSHPWCSLRALSAGNR